MNLSILSQRSINYTIPDYYISAIFSSLFALLAIIVSSIMLLLIYRNKTHLHTVNHLLLCNTSTATILYSVVTINNYIYLIFIRWDTSDMSCRIRAYFLFVGISQIIYSYMIQAVSRLFFSVFSLKYRFLTKYKTHYTLILIQWLWLLTITSPTLITDNVRFDPTALCWISSEYTLHIVYAFTAYYIFPVLIIIIIYIWIYNCVRQAKVNVDLRTNYLFHKRKRDLKILRNIVILVGILLVGGIPSILASSFPGKFIYLFSLTTQPLTALLAALSSILLDSQLRQVIKGFRHRTTTVMPFHQ